MNGRISVGLLTFALTLGCGGCVTTQGEKSVASNAGVPSANAKLDEVAALTKKTDGPKRTPKASTEIASGKLMEAEADADGNKPNPETQARLRDQARKAYQQALKIEPNNLEAHRCLAGLYVKTNDIERALDIYQKAMAKHPNEASLWYDLGLCHQRRKDMPESVKCLTKALEMDPQNRNYLIKLGFTLAWTGQLEQGLAHLTRAHGSALAHYNIARVLLQREQNELARHHLNVALRENSQLAEARELLNSLDNTSAKN